MSKAGRGLALATVVGVGVLVSVVVADGDCNFAFDAENVNISRAINAKCRRAEFDRLVSQYGESAVSADDRLCGVDNATELAAVYDSALCHSPVGDGVARSFIHKIRLSRELYYDDYTDVRKKRFRNKREGIEAQWNSLLVGLPDYSTWKFERATVLELNYSPLPEYNYTDGVEVKALIQFASDAVTADAYKAAFETLTDDATMGHFKLDRTDNYTDTVTDPPTCAETPEDDLGGDPTFPTDWTVVTGDSFTEKPAIATTVSFACDGDLEISDDADDFDAYDEKYSVLCNTLSRYSVPRDWPRCVPACPKELDDAPEATGLVPVVPKIKISTGKYGSYVCSNPVLGVERGASEFFEVLCQNTSLTEAAYQLPEEDDHWPACLTRTTTVSPVIPVAMKSMLDKATITLERRMAIEQYEEDFEIKEGEDWFDKMFIPAIICLGVFTGLTCCLTRNDSPMYRICADRNPYIGVPGDRKNKKRGDRLPR